MSKKTAKRKMELGRARKVLFQYRNEDLEDFEFIKAMHYLEDCRAHIIKAHIDGLYNKRAGTEEYKRGYAQALNDLEGLINQEMNSSENPNYE